MSKEIQLDLQLAMSRIRIFVRFAFLREAYVSSSKWKSVPGLSPKKPITEIFFIFTDDLVAFTSELYSSHLKLVKLQFVTSSPASSKFKNPPVKLVNREFLIITELFSTYARVIWCLHELAITTFSNTDLVIFVVSCRVERSPSVFTLRRVIFSKSIMPSTLSPSTSNLIDPVR